MQSRQVTFYVQLADLPHVVAAVFDDVLPLFSERPNFKGLTVMKADHNERTEIIAQSFWDDLEESDDVAKQFIDEIHRVTGQNPSRKSFDVIHAKVG
jgi:hypothetical protein